MAPTTPAPDRELPVMECPECHGTFRQKRKDQIFCQHTCNRRFYARKGRRGAKAVDMLKEWRETRGSKKGVLGDIAHMVDGWIRDDKEAGRE